VLRAPLGADKTRVALRMLIERHLMCRDMAAPAGGSAAGYVLLDSIRQWLLEQADDPPQWAAVQASHAGVFHRYTAEAMALLRAGQIPQSMAIYARAERDIEAGIAWERSHGDTAPWLQWRYEAGVLQMTNGSVFEAIEHLRDAVRQPVRGDEQRRRSAWCWLGLSRALEWVGDVPGAVFAVRQARQRSIGCGDDRLEGKIGHTLAMLRSAQLHLRAARMHIESVLRRGEPAGPTSKTCQNLCVFGEILALQGKYPEALAVAEAAFDAALTASNAVLAWTVQHWQAGLSLQLGLISRARAHVAEYTLSESLGFGRLPRFGMRGLEFLLDFECEQYESASSRLTQWRTVATGPHARLAIMVDLAAEFVMMEVGHEGAIRSMLSVSDSAFPFDDYVAAFYVQLHCYRLRVQDQRGDWREALVSLSCALRPIRRCENALWVSWLAEALAIVAARRGEHADATLFVERSEQLQREAGILPTPRQVTSWRRVRGMVGPSPLTLRIAGAGSASTMSVRDTIDRLERWALATLDNPAPASRPTERARAVVRR
jgi:tetratricopeptide (TPR) repeat protein